jgi:hypothetical protein
MHIERAAVNQTDMGTVSMASLETLLKKWDGAQMSFLEHRDITLN